MTNGGSIILRAIWFAYRNLVGHPEWYCSETEVVILLDSANLKIYFLVFHITKNVEELSYSSTMTSRIFWDFWIVTVFPRPEGHSQSRIPDPPPLPLKPLRHC